MVTHKLYEELFSGVFALYFAANIAAARDYNAFDTAAVMAGDDKALWRLLVGICFLNVIPTVYYVFMRHVIHALPLLGSGHVWSCGGFVDDLLVLCLGMAGAGFYRMFAGIMMCRSSRRQFVFYASRRCSQTQSVGRSQGDSIEGRNINRDGFYTRPSGSLKRLKIGAVDHIFGSAVYLFVPGLTVVVWATYHCGSVW